jgi:endogenous inhibitor of DNA gyrase (YacG/DUF329 family)
MNTKQVMSVCPQCNVGFSYYPSQYHDQPKIYCSRKCQSDASRVITNCPQCGKEFWYHRSWPRKYCSIKCRAANTLNNFGEYVGKEAVAVNCENCGKSFKKLFNQVQSTKHNFCSQVCYGEHVSKTRKGIPRPGVRGEKPHLQKRVTKNCPQCGKEFQVKLSSDGRRRFCSKACQSKSQIGTVSGENNFNWKGGYEPYYGPNWRQQRRNARARDNYTCRRCGVTEIELGCQLDVHHIKRFKRFGIKRYKEANSLDNLVSLCDGCHKHMEHHGL